MGCMARAEEGGGRSKMRVKDRDIRAAGTMNARALSLRKTHIINRAIWLIDGIGQRSDPAGACIARKGSSEGNTEASFSRVAAPFRGAWWAKSYATQHAEHLGVPVMPRNPFRYEMSLRSRAKGAWYGKATSRSGAVADCGGIPSSRNDLDLVEARAAASKKCRSRYAARNFMRKPVTRVLDSESVHLYFVQLAGPVR
ncbi:unnamed protein product [Scytosiphon promiscuus]